METQQEMHLQLRDLVNAPVDRCFSCVTWLRCATIRHLAKLLQVQLEQLILRQLLLEPCGKHLHTRPTYCDEPATENKYNSLWS